MKGMSKIIFIISLLFFGCDSNDNTTEPVIVEEENPTAVSKTNPMHLYMHYMPWFQTKTESGYWGSHWTMDTQNPEITDEDGKRQIASHYYPLIGPYDSKDPDVVEYHLLLMKYAGIDGVLIDWYGTHNVYDYKPNFNSSNILIEKAIEIGLKFAIVYEEYTAENVGKKTSKTAMEAAQEDVEYMESSYFSENSYITIDDKPLLMTFGPRYFKQPNQWTEIFEPLESEILFLPLWHHSNLVGNTGSGEFSWVDFNSSLSELNSFYKNTTLDYQIGSAYARFHDFYKEGGWGSSYGRVNSNNGEAIRNTLNKAEEFNVDYLQLVTWNDFGEGTQLEPTQEDQFLFLTIIQEFAGVSYHEEIFELIYNYYLKKKEYQNDEESLDKLKMIYQDLIDLKVEEAKDLLSEL